MIRIQEIKETLTSDIPVSGLAITSENRGDFSPLPEHLIKKTKSGLYITLDSIETRTLLNLKQKDYEPVEPHENMTQFQKRWIAEINTRELMRGCLILPMGSGKTLLGITIAAAHRPSLILCPKSVIPVIKEEMKKFSIEGITVSNYEQPIQEGYKCVILDEVLKIKNPDTIIYKKIKKEISAIPYRYGMLAHPISAKKSLDIRFLCPILFNILPENQYVFMNLFGLNTRYEKKEIRGGRVINTLVCDEYDLHSIGKRISPFIVTESDSFISALLPKHVIKTKVLLPRPPNWRQVCCGVYADFDFCRVPSQRRTITSGFIYNKDGSANDLNSIKEDFIASLLHSTPKDQKVVIFSSYTREIERLEKRFSFPSIRAGKNYEVELARYKTSRAIIISAHLSEGFNLQDASIVVFLSNSTSPVKRLQAIGRVIRPYQKNTTVTVVDVICSGTDDEKSLSQLDTYIDGDKEFRKVLNEKRTIQ